MTMGRPPVDKAWREFAFGCWSDVPRPTVTQVHALAVAKAKSEKRGDCPSPRTFARWRKEFGELTDDARTGYLKVSWPYSFAAGLLPWESASAVLELMYLGREMGRPPSVRMGRWYWRVTLAAPDMPPEIRRTLAENLCYWEPRAATDPVTAQGAEALLTYAFWRSQERAAAYQQALAAGAVPIPPVTKLEYLADLDKLRRLSRSELAKVLQTEADAVAEIDRIREGETDEARQQ